MTTTWNTVAPEAGELIETVGGVWSAIGTAKAVAPVHANSRVRSPNAKTCTRLPKASILSLSARRDDDPDPLVLCSAEPRPLWPRERAGVRGNGTPELRVASDSNDGLWRAAPERVFIVLLITTSCKQISTHCWLPGKTSSADLRARQTDINLIQDGCFQNGTAHLQQRTSFSHIIRKLNSSYSI
jgi:hypothetical protein